MKKIFVLVLAIIVGFSSAGFAGESEHNLGFGAQFPQFHFEGDSKISNFMFQFKDVMVKPSKFVFLYDFDVGYAKPKENGSTEGGIAAGVDLGFGYAIINNDRFLLSVAAVLGYDFFRLKSKISFPRSVVDAVTGPSSGVSLSSGTKLNYDYYFYDVNAGLDVFFSFRFNKKLGIFANVKFKYKAGFCKTHTSLSSGSKKFADIMKKSDGTNFSNGFEFSPSVGLVIHL